MSPGCCLQAPSNSIAGTSAANALAEQADVVLAAGTRLQDFTTGSWSLFSETSRRIVSLNVQPLDAAKHLAQPLVCDAKAGLEALSGAFATYRAPDNWSTEAKREKTA